MRQKSFEILSKKKVLRSVVIFVGTKSLHFSATFGWNSCASLLHHFVYLDVCCLICLPSKLPNMAMKLCCGYPRTIASVFWRRQLFLRLKNLRRNFFPTAPWQQKGDTMKRSSRRWKRLSLCRWSELWTWAPMSPCWNTTIKRLSIVYVAYVLFFCHQDLFATR